MFCVRPSVSKIIDVKKFYSSGDGQKTVTLCKNTSDKGFKETFQQIFHKFVDKKMLDSLNAENSGSYRDCVKYQCFVESCGKCADKSGVFNRKFSTGFPQF